MTSFPVFLLKRDPYAGDDVSPPLSKLHGPWGSRCPQAREFSLKLLGALRDLDAGRPDAKWGAAKRMRSSDRTEELFLMFPNPTKLSAFPFGVELEPKKCLPSTPASVV